jgi:hypothetical protein
MLGVYHFERALSYGAGRVSEYQWDYYQDCDYGLRAWLQQASGTETICAAANILLV